MTDGPANRTWRADARLAALGATLVAAGVALIWFAFLRFLWRQFTG